MADRYILVIKLSALGDFILCFGAFDAIRRQHSDAKITLLTTKPFVELATRSGWFDEIWVDQKPRWYQLGKWLALRRRLISKNFDFVYDLQTNDRTSSYYRLFRPNFPKWSGIARGASHRDTHPARHQLHAYELREKQLQIAGIASTPLPDLKWLNGDISQFNLPEKFVLLVPGCAPTRPEKRWPTSHYAILASSLKKDGLTPVLIGTNAEADVTAAIARAISGCIDLTGQTNLFDIAALARQASGAVGNDTGPMHLIAMCGCPSLSLFSNASNPLHSRPMGARTAFLQQNSLKDLTVMQVRENFDALLQNN